MTGNNQNLHQRAILVKLGLPQYTGTIEDKDVTREVLVKHSAAKGAGKFTKKLFPAEAHTTRQRDEGEELHAFDALVAHMNATRAWSYENTLPWTRDGWLVLPIKNYKIYTDYIREAKHKYEALKQTLSRDYYELVDDSKRCLNGLAANAKYLSKDEALARFDFTVEYAPIPSAGDFRVALTAEEIAAIAQTTESRVRETADAAQGEAVKRLYEVLDEISKTLKATNPNKKDGMKTFKDTLIGNARKVCDVLTRLNITDDPDLERFRKEAELLAQSEPETLRTLPALRAETADRAQSILDDMTATFGKGLFKK